MNRLSVRLSLFQIAGYLTSCVYQGCMSLYCAGLGFTAGQIGAVGAGVALSSIVAQPAWGALADRARSRRRLIALLAAASGGAALAFRGTARFLPLLLLACLFAGFYTPLQPLGDAVALDALNARGLPFGPLRLAGSLAYALGGLTFGRVLRSPGQYGAIPLWIAALCGLTALTALALPRAPGGRTRGARGGLAELLQDRPLMRLMAFTLPAQATLGCFYAFFSPCFMALPGASGGRLGLCHVLSALSGIPFLLTADRLFDRFGAARLLRASTALLALRWLLLGLARSAPAAMASQLLHGSSALVMSFCMAKHISRSVPGALRSSGQTLLGVVGFGVARAFGSLAGGLLTGALGGQRAFLGCAAACALTLLCGCGIEKA